LAQSRLFIAYAAVVLLCTLGSSIVLESKIRSELEADLKARLSQKAQGLSTLVAKSVVAGDTADLARIARGSRPRHVDAAHRRREERFGARRFIRRPRRDGEPPATAEKSAMPPARESDTTRVEVRRPANRIGTAPSRFPTDRAMRVRRTASGRSPTKSDPPRRSRSSASWWFRHSRFRSVPWSDDGWAGRLEEQSEVALRIAGGDFIDGSTMKDRMESHGWAAP
jgi:hypothetical protein